MSKFLKHIPCPRCKSRDNCGEYSDHFFCFGCKWYKPKLDLTSVKERRNTSDLPQSSSDLDLNLSEDIPKEALQWLLKYGITSKEIAEFNIKWAQNKEVLVLLHTKDYYQGRCFGNQLVKYLSKGSKPLTLYGKGDILVCVEDILSAIKIARSSTKFTALPLLGCTLPEDWIPELQARFNSVLIWLDRDKAKNALKISRNLKQKGFNSTIIVSSLDPKEYSTGEINEWLKKES